jgi:hypothetical protein
MYAILSLAGCAIMFFGYDASVMSLVNTNEDYLHLMGAASGSKRDSAAIGGLVSLWFGGFAMGIKILELQCIVADTIRGNFRWTLCGPSRTIKDDRTRLSLGHTGSSFTGISTKLHLDGICPDHWWRGVRSFEHRCANLDFRARRPKSERCFRGSRIYIGPNRIYNVS